MTKKAILQNFTIHFIFFTFLHIPDIDKYWIKVMYIEIL